jgi:hypothetical protein
VQENEESGTDYEPAADEASNYIVRRLRNRGGKKVATWVQENEESGTDYEPAVEAWFEAVEGKKVAGTQGGEWKLRTKLSPGVETVAGRERRGGCEKTKKVSRIPSL